MQNWPKFWKYVLFSLILLIGFIYALPNFFGEDPAVQVAPITREAKQGLTQADIQQSLKDQIVSALNKVHLPYRSLEWKTDHFLVRFKDADLEFKAKDVLKEALGPSFIVAATLATATPQWLQMLGAHPMRYGLDLRGGIHFLMEVDIQGTLSKRLDGFLKSLGETLRQHKLRYHRIEKIKQGLIIQFRQPAMCERAWSVLKKEYPLLSLQKKDDGLSLLGRFTQEEMNTSQDYAIEQSITILRNRVNELGIGEAIVQRQGRQRISVDLPGIQDATRAKSILRGTATLAFHMVDDTNDALLAKQTGVIPMGSQLYTFEDHPILLKSLVVLSGSSITHASSTWDQQTNSPAVQIQLGGGGEGLFARETRDNVGRSMAIVYVEIKSDDTLIDGRMQRVTRKEERIISVARIDQALGNHFIISHLAEMQEASQLALLLRAGALPAPLFIVEERLIGPTLGQENVRHGLISLTVGMGIILIIMLAYYRTFGLFANLGLLMNLVLLVAILSILGATLTLPGMAGLVLTVGMAVDANVLIYERIREELRHGLSPLAAINAGYDRAFATIVDANLTTLLVMIILYTVGSGPVQGFALVTAVGLLTSMLTGVVFTRAMVDLYYGRQRGLKTLSIGTLRSSLK